MITIYAGHPGPDRADLPQITDQHAPEMIAPGLTPTALADILSTYPDAPRSIVLCLPDHAHRLLDAYASAIVGGDLEITPKRQLDTMMESGALLYRDEVTEWQRVFGDALTVERRTPDPLPSLDTLAAIKLTHRKLGQRLAAHPDVLPLLYTRLREETAQDATCLALPQGQRARLTAHVAEEADWLDSLSRAQGFAAALTPEAPHMCDGPQPIAPMDLLSARSRRMVTAWLALLDDILLIREMDWSNGYPTTL